MQEIALAPVLGLIPAHAGKTNAPRMRFDKAEAHPRSRGENALRRAGVSAAHGSSPLTRGKRAVIALTDDFVGLIPAHAGKTR